MLNLMLLRHAKASLAEAGQEDFDRPLNERGQRAALAMGRHMASQGLLPQRVLCSPARRARETLEFLVQGLGASPETHIVPEIYGFGNGKPLIACIRDHAGAAPSILLVGHNPAIAGLARSLAGLGSGKLSQRLQTKYPTAALSVISFAVGSWREIAQSAGTLLSFITPKELGAGGDE